MSTRLTRRPVKNPHCPDSRRADPGRFDRASSVAKEASLPDAGAARRGASGCAQAAPSCTPRIVKASRPPSQVAQARRRRCASRCIPAIIPNKHHTDAARRSLTSPRPSARPGTPPAGSPNSPTTALPAAAPKPPSRPARGVRRPKQHLQLSALGGGCQRPVTTSLRIVITAPGLPLITWTEVLPRLGALTGGEGGAAAGATPAGPCLAAASAWLCVAGSVAWERGATAGL